MPVADFASYWMFCTGVFLVIIALLMFVARCTGDDVEKRKRR